MRVKSFLLALLLVLLPVSGYAAGDKALMLTVFGTSTEASVTFDELLPLVKKQFPGRTVVVPYTSHTIRKKLNEGSGSTAEKILSPEEMLEKLKKDGFTDVAVVSTLVFPGVEHDKLEGTVKKFAADNPDIAISYTPPILSDEGNRKAVVGFLGKYMIPGGLNVVVSHGTHEGHPVEKIYENIAGLIASSYPNARMGSIEGVPSMESAMNWVKEEGSKDIRFIVFMFVAGDHAENDIASDDGDSLFSAAKSMGKTPSVFWVDTRKGKRIASLGLDGEYRQLLLDYYAKHVKR